MGPSGSGKSTLLSILGGLLHPIEGRLIVDDIEVYALPSDKRADFRREYIGFIFQSFHLIPYLSVIENVLLPLAPTSMIKREQKARAMDLLLKVGLDRKAGRLADEMSAGEQQRAAIARALICRPPIVLAGEPTGNLDTTTWIEVMQLLQSLYDERGTIIMVTHNPENLAFVNRCVYLQDGKLAEPEFASPRCCR